MYAERKGWLLNAVEVQLSHARVHAKDCEDCDTTVGYLDEIHSVITLKGNLDDTQRKRMMEIATKCPVHRTLTHEVKIHTSEASS